MTLRDKELLIASNAGYLTSVLKCIFAGADVNVSFDGSDVSPLILSAANGYGSIVTALLANGAEKSNCDNECKTATDYAFENGHDNVFKILTGHALVTSLKP